MSFVEKLVQAYFNIAYNQVYDYTTAGLSLYQKLQEGCIGKFTLRNDDKVLCVGVGTGNEISYILEMNKNVRITGVDYSSTALRKAHRKALRLGKEIELILMDARHLDFTAGSFDKVLCLHVTDFIGESEDVTNEIFRVLRDGGQFVITYPSDKEGPKLGMNLLKDRFRHDINSMNYIKALLKILVRIVMGTVYLPLLLRPKNKFYSHNELEAMFLNLVAGDFQIDEYPMYQDFIVYGTK
ncbi:class I SAM-dependent methyltransferase [Chloroflexota bacterium]